MSERQKLFLIIIVFLAAYFMPTEHPRVQSAILEAFAMLHEYAREHVLLCLVPAFFIAGAVSVFVRQDAVMRYLGAGANKLLAYSVASVSGTILAVCSCTVLPLFAGIYTRGAGIGPATAFLYSGPAINILAIVMTARILGLELGVARTIGAIAFSVIIGLAMAFIYREEEKAKEENFVMPDETNLSRKLWQEIVYFATMVAFLVFANWGRPLETTGFWATVYAYKWWLAGVSLAGVLFTVSSWFKAEERHEWYGSAWFFAKQILPLLLGGVLFAGLLLGRPGTDAGLIPDEYVKTLVGGNSLGANLFASIMGALMYFATLTEVPIIQGLLGSGMGKGPALALLLAGPALSLPSMLVIRQIMGTQKTLVYVSLVVVMSTITGMIYGALF
ncbi:permease [Thermosinus carboxydivorans Nor1]|uniref:Permease n=1 Tax=Thermosinus carboxydivorans Nor1 TaxID=401526 RepID=A1HQT5_9FIRM|nr:permease [Thermosinus carboxydivorans]EAX47645.1 permease [Thermosinus carboxydivorans Nor1]